MSRAWRVQFQGAMYHVMNRGVERRKLFLQQTDFEKFERCLSEAIERYVLEISSYTLMPNHYHLVLRTPEANLSSALQWLQTSYALYFNKEHQRKGHLFQGRFKALLVGDEDYLATLSAYVHWNSVRAGLAGDPSEYRWSSYIDYVRRRQRHRWVHRKMVLGRFGRNFEEQRKRYYKWLYAVSGKEKDFWDEVKHGYILGKEKFVESVQENFATGAPDEQPTKRAVRGEQAVERVLRAVAQTYGVKPEELVADTRRGKDKKPRDVALYLLWTDGSLPNRKIGERFGIKYAAVSLAGRRIKERLERDERLRATVAKCAGQAFSASN